MKKTITIYELLGKIKDDKDTDIYVKYMNRMTEKEDTMWSCVENIIDKLDNKVVYLNDEVEILSDEEEFENIEQIQLKDGRIITNYDGENHYMTINVKDREVYIKSINQLIKNQKKIIEKLNDAIKEIKRIKKEGK